jgi:hypothetical protein
MSLAGVYILNELRAVRSGGIEAVMQLQGGAGSWSDLVAVNPRNKDRLLAIGPEKFEAVMTTWLEAFTPKPTEPIPGVPDSEFAKIKVPTLIVRGGEKDYDHPKRTSFEVATLIKGSRLIEPPWPEDAWEQASKARSQGKGTLFDPWVEAAPALLDFMAGKPGGVATFAGQ